MAVYYGNNAPQRPSKVNFDWINEAWFLFKQAPGTWICATLLTGGGVILISLLTQGLTPQPVLHPGDSPSDIFLANLYASFTSPAGWIERIAGVLLGAAVNSMLYGLAVRQVRGAPITLRDLPAGLRFYLPMLLLNVVSSLLIYLGCFACCVGGLFVSGLLFPSTAMVADGVPFSESLSRSYAAMKQDWFRAGGFILGIGVLVLISCMACGLGALITLPMYCLCGALAYRDMVGMDGYTAESENVPPQPGVWPPPPSQN